MRYLKPRPNRLRLRVPASADRVRALRDEHGHEHIEATGTRGAFRLVTRYAMNSIGDVYLTAEWQRVVQLADARRKEQ